MCVFPVSSSPHPSESLPSRMLERLRYNSAKVMDCLLESLNKDCQTLAFTGELIGDMTSNIPPYYSADEEEFNLSTTVSSDGTSAAIKLRSRNDFELSLENDSFSMSMNADGVGEAALRWSSNPFTIGGNSAQFGIEAKTSSELLSLLRVGPLSAKVIAKYVGSSGMFAPLLCSASYRLYINDSHAAHVAAQWESTDSLLGSWVLQGPQYGMWGSMQISKEETDEPNGNVGASFIVGDSNTVHCAASITPDGLGMFRGGFESKLERFLGRDVSVFAGLSGEAELGLGVSSTIEGLGSLSVGMHTPQGEPLRFGLEVSL
jgi:hypothetical protein